MSGSLYRKGLVVGIILLFVGVGIQPTFANELSVSKKVKEFEVTTEFFTIEVYAMEMMGMPGRYVPVGLVKMTLTSEDGTINRVRYTGAISGTCYFRQIPNDKNYTLSAYKPRYKVNSIIWEHPYYVYVWMVWMGYTGKSKTIDSLFMERFPLLNLLLQRLRI